MPENLFQSEAESAKPLIQKELFCSHANKTHFHKEGFPLSFALKVRVFGTRIWSIKVRVREDCLIVSRNGMNFELTTFLQSTGFFFCFFKLCFLIAVFSHEGSFGESDFIILRFQSRYGSLGPSDTSLCAARVRIRRVTDLHSAVHIDKHMITQEREGL